MMYLVFILFFFAVLGTITMVLLTHESQEKGGQGGNVLVTDKAGVVVSRRPPEQVISREQELSREQVSDVSGPSPPAPTSGPPFSAASADFRTLEAQSFGIIQFDTRPLKNYWEASAKWNAHYCKKHGHIFIYYSLRKGDKCFAVDKTTLLADPWCKVKAMLTALEQYPRVNVFLYMDSDAVIDKRFEEKPLNHLLSTIKDRLDWQPSIKPIIFNQDGPCWWCQVVKKAGFNKCLNAGTVLWVRHKHAERVLRDWWQAALDPYEGNPIKRKFRLSWPWEQDRQMLVYNRTPEHIQVASQPDRMFMDMRAGHKDWCLSHLARSGCFVSHYCEGRYSKEKLDQLYREFDDSPEVKVNYLQCQ